MSPTHEVVNQVPPLGDIDTAADPALLEALHREGAGWAEADVHAAGRPGASRPGNGAGARTSTRRCCALTIASGTGSTRSSSIRHGTNCWARPSGWA
jgi:hypothetical protein